MTDCGEGRQTLVEGKCALEGVVLTEEGDIMWVCACWGSAWDAADLLATVVTTVGEGLRVTPTMLA